MDYKPGFNRRKWTITWHYINLTIIPFFGDLILHGILLVMIIHVATQFYSQIDESIKVERMGQKINEANAALMKKSQTQRH